MSDSGGSGSERNSEEREESSHEQGGHGGGKAHKSKSGGGAAGIFKQIQKATAKKDEKKMDPQPVQAPYQNGQPQYQQPGQAYHQQPYQQQYQQPGQPLPGQPYQQPGQPQSPYQQPGQPQSPYQQPGQPTYPPQPGQEHIQQYPPTGVNGAPVVANGAAVAAVEEKKEEKKEEKPDFVDKHLGAGLKKYGGKRFADDEKNKEHTKNAKKGFKMFLKNLPMISKLLK